MHPKNISIKDFTYDLPAEMIARYPVTERDLSKLLIYNQAHLPAGCGMVPGKKIDEDIFRNIDTYLPENSLLVFNNTKVVEARLLFQKPTGGIIEIFCLEPHEEYTDIASAMMKQEKVLWKCLLGGASKWKRGQVLEKRISTRGKEMILSAAYAEKRTDHFIIEFSWSPGNISFAELLHLAGAIPLPPYLKRESEAADAERYQTIYACHDGSVAAPTAGLHFTEAIFGKLIEKNIRTDFVTLHVGAGTFKPVKSETMEDHEMHAEFIDISVTTINNILHCPGNNIIAVGTTSLRTIESLYWLGVKTALSPGITSLQLSQWEAYELAGNTISPAAALNALLGWMDKKKLNRLITKTQILIAPGYKTKIARGLITNFHQPNSTLLLLVAALIGKDWKAVYDYALKNNFRFLSYGDGGLLWIEKD